MIGYFRLKNKEFQKFTDANGCGSIEERYIKAVLTDFVTNKDYVVILDGDVARSLEKGQMVLADLLRDESTPPWDSWYVAESITALDKKVVDLRHKKRLVK